MPEFVCDSHDRKAWLMHRTTGIGGSDAPAILGLEKAWGNPFSVSCLKRGITLSDEEDPETELMEWGHCVEPAMIAKFSDETGHMGQVSGGMFRRTDPGFEMMMATLDGTVTEKGGKVGGIECKLVIYTTREWEEDGIPEHVICQATHTCAVMGWDFIYVLGLLDGFRLRWKKLEPNPDWLGDILQPAEVSFWNRLEAGDEFDAGLGRPDQSKGFLKHLHPNDNGETVRLQGEQHIEVYDEWQLAKADAKAAKTRVEQAKNHLIQACGDNTFGVLDDSRRISLKSQTRKPHEVKGSTFRVLR